jgi:phosphoribosylanthranilate isomerase
MIIKICGLKDRQVLEAAVTAGADMAGFVHFGKSPRHLEPGAIKDLIAVAEGRIETCVLLVDPDDDLIHRVAGLGADWVQLHGRETPARVAAIGAMTKGRVMKALGVAGPSDLAMIADFGEVADRLLLDAKAPPAAGRPGGLGEVFDWSVLKNVDRDIRFMLAGGLSPDNVGAAIAQVGPFGVDVSSGVEVSPGVKSKSAIAGFVAAVRRAEGAGQGPVQAGQGGAS